MSLLFKAITNERIATTQRSRRRRPPSQHLAAPHQLSPPPRPAGPAQAPWSGSVRRTRGLRASGVHIRRAQRCERAAQAEPCEAAWQPSGWRAGRLEHASTSEALAAAGPRECGRAGNALCACAYTRHLIPSTHVMAYQNEVGGNACHLQSVAHVQYVV